MKKVLIACINLYQKMPLRSHHLCRFQPTCSQYAKESIENYGVLKGSILATKRILKCNPLGPSGFDPIPIKENKNEKN